MINSCSWSSCYSSCFISSLKATLWWAFAPGRIIVLYFFENSITATVFGDWYPNTIEHTLFYLRLNCMLWAWLTCDFNRQVTERIPLGFQQVISGYGDVDWPPRSPDLLARGFICENISKERGFQTNQTNSTVIITSNVDKN